VNNWSTAAVPTAVDEVFFESSTFGEVSLGGLGFEADRVEFNHAGVDQSNANRLTNGTLTTSAIRVTDDQYGEFVLMDVGVTAAAGDLSVELNTGSIDFQQVINATNVSVTGGGGEVRLTNAGNTITGKFRADFMQVSAFGAGTMGTGDVELYYSNFYAVSSVASETYGNNMVVPDLAYGGFIAYAATFPPAPGGDLTFGNLSVGVNSDAVFYGYNGYDFVFGQIKADTGAAIGGESFDTLGRTVIRTESVQAVGGNTRLDIEGAVEVIISGDGSGSGVAEFGVTRGQLRLASSSAVPDGTAVDVGAFGSLFVEVVPTGVVTATVGPYGAIAGDLTGRAYSGGLINTTLNDGSVVAAYDPAANVPVRGVDVVGAEYYLGLTSTTQAVVVGDDGATSIYKGAAIGLFTPDGDITATFDTAAPEQELSVLMSGGPRFFVGSSFGGSALRFSGPGEVRFLGPQALVPGVISHTGNPVGNSQGNYLMTLYGVDTLPADTQLSIDNGILFTGEPATMAASSELVIGPTGTYYIGDFFGVTSSPTSGSVTVQSGGAVLATSATPGHGASFTFEDGTYVGLNSSFDSLTPSWLPPQADVVVVTTNAIAVAGEGIVLGEGKRLTTGAYGDATIDDGAPILREGMASRVLLTAASDTIFGSTQTLTIRTAVDLPGTTLEIGATDVFSTLNFAFREERGQAGIVRVERDLTANTVDVVAGRFYFGDEDFDPFDDGTLTAERLVYRSTGGGDSALLGGTVAVTAHAIEAGFFSYYNRNLVFSGQPSMRVTGATMFMGVQETSTFLTPLDAGVSQLVIGTFGQVTQFGPADPFTDTKGTVETTDDESMNVSIDPFGQIFLFAGARLGQVTGRGGITVGGLVEVSVGGLQAGGVFNGGLITVRPGEDADGTIELTSLTQGFLATFTTTSNDMLVDYPAGPSPVADLINMFLAGSLMPDGDDGFGLPTYLAIAEAVDLGLAEFNGISVDETTVVLKFTYVGDANLDGQVDALDYERVDLAIGNTGVFGVAQGDLNYDGNVDALDYEQIDLNIGNGVGSPLGAVFVPEPAGLGVGLATGLLMARRRR
jgi:hypothetical protein